MVGFLQCLPADLAQFRSPRSIGTGIVFDRIRELLGIEQGIRMRNRESNFKPYGRYMSPIFRQLPEPLVCMDKSLG